MIFYAKWFRQSVECTCIWLCKKQNCQAFCDVQHTIWKDVICPIFTRILCIIFRLETTTILKVISLNLGRFCMYICMGYAGSICQISFFFFHVRNHQSWTILGKVISQYDDIYTFLDKWGLRSNRVSEAFRQSNCQWFMAEYSQECRNTALCKS